MAIDPNPTAAVLLLLLFLLAPPSSAASSVISELSALQSKSPDGVIHLTDALLRRILSLPTPRPFHFVVFFDAEKLHSKPELALPTLRSEFALTSSSFRSNNPDKKTLILFFDIEFDESQPSFAEFGINSLPSIRLVPPSAADLKSNSVPMAASDYNGLAESMADFILSKTNIPVGPINRPPAVSRTQVVIAIAAVLIWTPFFVKKLISGKTFLHEKSSWMAGAIFVYFFSVSGTMFNIIRKMPMFMVDRQGGAEKLVFFYRGSGMQLGAEGFAVGFLYTVVGLLMAFVVHGLVGVKNISVQRSMMIGVMLVSCWAVRKVILLDQWKTGYGVRGYWPLSWR